MLKASIDTERGNDAIRSGKLPEMMKEVLDQIKPEAAYFTTDGGDRTAYLVFDMKESSQMPVMAEQFFMQLGAKIDFKPVMNTEELQTGLSKLR
jgi:hypothetical protein